MRRGSHTNYLAGYPEQLVQNARELIGQGRLAGMLLRKYPHAHQVRTDKALYDYVMRIKQDFLRNAGRLNRVAYDSDLHVVNRALGMHAGVSRIQGSRLKASREIRIASLFRDMPQEFLRMIAVHEIAHFREREHNRAFYQFCTHMEPEYLKLEFEVRTYLSYLAQGGSPLWSGAAGLA